MAPEARLVEVTNMLEVERARVSLLEQRTSQLESQLCSFKAVVLSTLRQSMHCLEKELAVDSTTLAPPTTAATLVHGTGRYPDDRRGVKSEASAEKRPTKSDISQNPAKPRSVDGACINSQGHAISHSMPSSQGSALSVSQELGASKRLLPNPSTPRGHREPRELYNNILPYPLNSTTDDQPSGHSSAPYPLHTTNSTPMESASTRLYAIKTNTYDHCSGSSDRGPDLSRKQRQTRSRSKGTGTGQRVAVHRSRSRDKHRYRDRGRSRSRKRGDEYGVREHGRAHPGYRRRADRSGSPEYIRRNPRRSYGGNYGLSPENRWKRESDRPEDVLYKVEQDLRAHSRKMRNRYGAWRDNDDDDGNDDNDDSENFSAPHESGKGHPYNDKAAGGWAVYSYDAEGKNDDKGATGFAMPRSIAQIMNKDLVSPRDKVLSWQKDAVVGSAPEPTNAENATDHIQVTSESTTDGLDYVAKPYVIDGGLDSSPDNHPRVQETIPFANLSEDGANDNDDDDDDDDPFACLRSKSFQTERAMSMLIDSAGTPITTENLAPLWRASAWVPLDDMASLYSGHYKKELCTPKTRKKIRLHLPKLPNISERQTYINKRACTLLFMKGSHLANPKAQQRVFIQRVVAEPALFFFLTTSVYWPLEYNQATIIYKMWNDQYKYNPVGLTTVGRRDGSDVKSWLDMKTLWRSAIEWLKELVAVATKQGCKYLLNKVSNWGDIASISVTTSRNEQAWTMARDSEADLVYGLGRDELLGVLKMAPVLLRTILSKADVLSLEDELELL